MAEARAVLERLSALGAGAQASVPGVYAWGVTVAPAAWSHGASFVAKVAAGAAIAALATGVAGEARWGTRARLASLWAFVVSSALAWSAAPEALAPLRIDAPRGVAGMLGWALFAFASAAPALRGRREQGRVVIDEDSLAPRKRLSRGDATYVVVGAAIAAALQLVGWRAATAERALLVRFVTVAAGLAIVGAATDVALARHFPRAPRSSRRRLRGATSMLVAAALLALTGLLFAVRG